MAKGDTKEKCFIVKMESRDAAGYEIRFYQNTNFNGNTRFSSEVDIGLNDKIILDDQSMASLRYKLSLVLPAALYSRKG